MVKHKKASTKQQGAAKSNEVLLQKGDKIAQNVEWKRTRSSSNHDASDTKSVCVKRH